MTTVSKLLENKHPAVWHSSPDATVFEALQIMDEKGIGALPILLDDKLVGIISERDYARNIALKGKSSKETPIKDIMTRKVCYTTPTQSLEDCMVLMTEKRVRHLPVLENNKVVGMLSLGDVVKEIIKEQRYKIKELENYISWEESY